MPNYSATETIEASADVIWGFLSNVTQWPEYFDTFTSIVPLDSPQLAMGARFRVLQPGVRPAVWEVLRLEAPLRFTWQARSPGLVMLADHCIDRIAEGTCRLRLDFGFSGPLGWPLGLAFGGKTRRFLRSEIRALKRLSEGGRCP